MTEQDQIEAGIAALEAQRPLLGDAVVEMAVAPLRAKLAALTAPPAEPPAPEQQLKQATVLFTDVVGSTTLSQHLDPEDIHQIMDGALERFTSIVKAHKGRVLQYAGDSMLAVFGAEGAHEDDPERAVRTGLAVLDEARAVAAEVRRQYGHEGFNVRVGISTGPVLLGGGVDEENSVRGITVNTCSAHGANGAGGGPAHQPRHLPPCTRGVRRHQAASAAREGSGRAARHLPGAKGQAARVPRHEPRHRGHRDPHGRTRRRAGTTAGRIPLGLSGAQAVAVAVVAEAGLGKSRLLYEFENWAEAQPEQFFVFRGRAQPLTEQQPYGLLRDVLAWRLLIADSDDADSARKKLVAGIAPLFGEDGEAQAHVLGHVIGLDFSASPHVLGLLDDAKQLRNRAFHAAAQTLRRMTERDGHPAMLMLDDLHWADEGSLDFINYLFQVNRDVPALLLCLTRPSLFERRSSWASVESAYARINLEPLDKRASRELTLELLQRLDTVPAALRDLVTSAAEGNPFHMEELVKMLVDEGAIADRRRALDRGAGETGDGPCAAHADRRAAGAAGQPAGRREAGAARSVGRRLRLLGPGARRARRALGRSPGLDRQARTRAPQRLGCASMACASTSSATRCCTRWPTTACSSASGASTTPGSRPGCPSWVGARAGEMLGLTAEHFERAGDTTRACEFFCRAAEYAAARYANAAMMAHVARALALAGEADHGTRWRLLVAREKYLRFQDDQAAHAADLEALQALANALGDDACRAEVAHCRASTLIIGGEPVAAEAQAREALELADRAGTHALAAQAACTLADTLIRQGLYEAAQRVMDERLPLARRHGDTTNEPALLNMVGLIAMERGDLMLGAQSFEQSLAMDRVSGNLRRQGIELNNLGAICSLLGDYAQARRHLDDGLRVSRDAGRRDAEASVLVNLASVTNLQGDDASTLAYANKAYEVATACGQRDLAAYARLVCGHAELALGRYAFAVEAYSQSRDQLRELQMRRQQVLDPVAGLARVALALGDLPAALEQVEFILAHMAAGGRFDGTEEPLRLPLTCYQVLSAAGDPRAADVLANAHAELMKQADRISDPQARRSFLQNVPHNREIVAAWSRRAG